MSEKLPVLVAAVESDQARALEEAARVGRHVWLALKWPPEQLGPHKLEVYTPQTRAPLRLLAEPLGTSSDKGYALRLYPWEDEEDTIVNINAVDASPDQLVGRPLAGGRFEILSVLGEGSIGSVYRARHTGLGIVVALKVLHEAFQRDAEFCRRFYAEALALSRLDHANLVHIYDFGQEPDGLLYIAMTLVDGLTLRAIQTRDRRFDMRRAVTLMLQVSAGLGHAHVRGLIHRDVKPDNVMIVTKVDDDGNRVENVKLLDFGFAVPPDVSADVAQRLAGTPVYMSPEQCLGEELDARSDVYACGIMLYELMIGTVPFLAQTAEAIHQMQIEEPPPFMSEIRPEVDPRLDRLVQKALSKSREARHPSMQELRSELKTLLAPEGVSSLTNLRTTGAFERKSIPAIPSIPTPRLPSLPPLDLRHLALDAASATPPDQTADALAANPAGWLGDLAQERDPRAFTRRFRDLEGAVRVLAQRCDVKTLQILATVITRLEQRLGSLTTSDEGAAEAISRIARLFSDPEILGPLAAHLLSSDEGRAATAELIARAGVHGAYALYSTRTKLAIDPRARIAFVTTMKALGESAMPVVRAGLERIEAGAVGGDHRGAVDLAEDLLLAVPASIDEVAGHLVVKYAASPIPNLCRAAARALPRVWGSRARSLLVSMIDHADDGARVAAIMGLREIGAIDAEVIARMAALFAGGQPRSAQLRAAAVAALKGPVDGARAEAAALLEHLTATGG
jgi:serine/threonine-protein kinase